MCKWSRRLANAILAQHPWINWKNGGVFVHTKPLKFARLARVPALGILLRDLGWATKISGEISFSSPTLLYDWSLSGAKKYCTGLVFTGHREGFRFHHAPRFGKRYQITPDSHNFDPVPYLKFYRYFYFRRSLFCGNFTEPILKQYYEKLDSVCLLQLPVITKCHFIVFLPKFKWKTEAW